MSVHKWLYDAEICDNEICCGDCDHCSEVIKDKIYIKLEKLDKARDKEAEK